MTCAECCDLLLDFLYGLLDEKEAQGLREHLDGCAACQEALVAAKDLKNLIARAAQKCRDVPLFEPPADEVEPLKFPQSTPSTLPLPSRARKTWRHWTAIGAAAAILLAVGTLYAGYQRELSERRQTIADARKEVEALDAKLDLLVKESQAEQAALASKLQEKYLQVNVVGPTNYQPNVSNQFRVNTLTPAGKPASAEVTVKVLNQNADNTGQQVVLNQAQQSSGDVQIQLPPNLTISSSANPRLVIEASNNVAKQVIEQPLTVAAPTYMTHLATNKTTLRPGETLFFRTVTLQRFALKPVETPLTLGYTLYRVVGSNLQLVKEFTCTTQSGGIAGGEMALADNLPIGDYIFVVAEAGAAANKISTVRPTTRHIVLERANQPPIIAGGGAKGALGGKGGGGKAKQPMANLVAEFFPEGGDLVAGAPNRVYFRLDFPNLIPKGVEAVVENGKQQEIVNLNLDSDRTSVVRGQLLGSFAFTPNFAEPYRFRLSVAGKQLDSWPLPKVRQSGVTLAAPRPILSANEPLHVRVGGPQREPLLVVATCRGQTVDQKIVETGDRPTDVLLEPLAGSNGVLRVTVYEKDGKDWRPAAERLVYRQPAAFLNLSTNLLSAANTDRRYKAGDQVNMSIESRDEAGAKSASWLFAAVIDEKFVRFGDQQQAGPPAFFLLNGDVHDPESLEDADFLLTGTPAAAKALDLFLGTQGWRKFAEQQPSDAPTKLIASETQQQSGQLALFSAGNQSDAALGRFLSAVKQQQLALAQQTARQRDVLHSQRESAAAAALSAMTALSEYEQMPMTWLRLGVGVSVLVLVVFGAALLLFGLIVAVRGKSSPRMLLASSCCVLLLAVLLFAGTGSLRTTEDASSIDPARLAWLVPHKGPLDKEVPPALIAPLAEKFETAKVTVDQYAAAPSAKDAAAARGEGRLGAANLAVDRIARLELNASKLGAFGALAPGGGKGGFGGGAGGAGAAGGVAGAGGSGAGGGAGKKGAAPSTQPQMDKMNSPQSTQSTGGLAPAPAAAADLRAKDATRVERLRVFANFNSQTALTQPELLLWHPNLLAADGDADVTFDLPGKAANYRVVIYGHTADGRLGVFHGKLMSGEK